MSCGTSEIAGNMRLDDFFERGTEVDVSLRDITFLSSLSDRSSVSAEEKIFLRSVCETFSASFLMPI